MKYRMLNTGSIILIMVYTWLCSPVLANAQKRDVNIRLHLRGIYQSKISILPLPGGKGVLPIAESQSLSGSEPISLTISADHLPGQFILRFDFKEKTTGNSYPAEKLIFLNNQHLDLWINPKFCNNDDSTWFQTDEIENTSYQSFLRQNTIRKKKLLILQNLLITYGDTETAFYGQAIQEYQKQRTYYNQWLKEARLNAESLFVSNIYPLNYLPEIKWHGTENERLKTLIDHYFEGIDLGNHLILNTTEFRKWMDSYVNLYGILSTTKALLDSLLPQAARIAIEKARQGHPKVYGWMVDYFYKGFETNNIITGFEILEPYINDPLCLTTRRSQIINRLQGIKTLAKGSVAPNISMIDSNNKLFDLATQDIHSTYILLLFWSAGCDHCIKLIDELQPWYLKNKLQAKIQIIGISVDRAETEVKLWAEIVKELKDWKHLHAIEGNNSIVARNYSVSATPTMFLLNAETKQIMAIPNSMQELLAIPGL
jgi:thioredoxin-related protein